MSVTDILIRHAPAVGVIDVIGIIDVISVIDVVGIVGIVRAHCIRQEKRSLNSDASYPLFVCAKSIQHIIGTAPPVRPSKHLSG